MNKKPQNKSNIIFDVYIENIYFLIFLNHDYYYPFRQKRILRDSGAVLHSVKWEVDHEGFR